MALNISREEWARISRRTRHQTWIRALLDWKVTSPVQNDDLKEEQKMRESLAEQLARLDNELEDVTLPEKYQRVILQDIERTRGEYPSFHTPEMQDWMARAIALFLKEHDVEYMQGLNEMLAPFLFIAADGASIAGDNRENTASCLGLPKGWRFSELGPPVIEPDPNLLYSSDSFTGLLPSRSSSKEFFQIIPAKPPIVSSMVSHEVSGVASVILQNIQHSGPSVLHSPSASSTAGHHPKLSLSSSYSSFGEILTLQNFPLADVPGSKDSQNELIEKPQLKHTSSAPCILEKSTLEGNEKSMKSDAQAQASTGEEYPPGFVVKPSSLAYLLFSRFVTRFQPCMFTKNDEHISTLRCHLALLGQLVPYHDPELAIHLAETGMTPDLYATPWFVTLFARTTPIEVILNLWDRYIQEDYNAVHQFVVLAFILHHRQLLLSTHEEYVPETLTRLAWLNRSDATSVWEKAQSLMKQTPASFYTALEALCYDPTTPPAIRAQIIQRLQTFSCMQISASDVADSLLSFPLQPAYSSSSSTFSWKQRRRVHGKPHCRFLLIDCRPGSEVSANYIKGTFRLDPKHLSTPQASPEYNGPYGQLTHLIAQLQSMPEHVHFCLYGRSSRATVATAYAHLLLQRRFSHVGILHGGYPALVAELESRGWLPKNGVYNLPQATGGEATLLASASGGGFWGPGANNQQTNKEASEHASDLPLWQRLAMPRFILQSALSKCFADSLDSYTHMAKHFAATEYVRHTAPAKAMKSELKVTLKKLHEVREEISLKVPSLADQLAGRF